MAVRITASGGEEWRSGMNNIPVFVVATPQAFYEATLAPGHRSGDRQAQPGGDATFRRRSSGKRAVSRMGQDRAVDGELRRPKLQQPRRVPLYRCQRPLGHLVRWSMEAKLTPAHEVGQEKISFAGLGPDFLEQDLKQRLANGPLAWRLLVDAGGAGVTRRTTPPRPGPPIASMSMSAQLTVRQAGRRGRRGMP